MKHLKTLFYCSIFTFLIGSCKLTKPPILDCQLKEVSVQSGNIKDKVFAKNTTKGFNSADNAMGGITPIIGSRNNDIAIDCSKNAYQDQEGYVYIFEGNSIPSEFKKIEEKKRCLLFKRASWKLEKTYTLLFDAEICVDERNFTIYMREKGDYPLYKATVGSFTVHKYYNRFLIEDYSNFLRFHEYFRPNMVSENLVDKMELDPTLYKMRYNANPVPNGKLDYATLVTTAIGATDKIYFESIVPKNFSYRIRHIYVKHSEAILKKYFCENSGNCDLSRVTQVKCNYQRDESSYTNETSQNEWFQYLNQKVFPSYLEPTIKGYECDCKNRLYNPYSGSKKNFRRFKNLFLNPLDSPPLPASSNGGPE